jgi:hypothetical protein
MTKKSPLLLLLEERGIIKPSNKSEEAIEASAAQLTNELNSLFAESKARPFGTIEISDNREPLEDFARRSEINRADKGKDLSQQADFKGKLQNQRTDAKIAQQDNLTRNTLDLMAIPAGVLDNQSAERSKNVDNVLRFGTNENAADRELQKRAMTQDLITKLALGAALAFG